MDELTHGLIVDVVFDVDSKTQLQVSAARRPGGLAAIVSVGVTSIPSHHVLRAEVGQQFDPSEASTDRLNLRTSSCREITDLLFELLKPKHIDVASMIAERHIPADATSVYAKLAAGQLSPGGICFDWTRLTADG